MKKILLLAFCASLFVSASTNAQNLKQSGGEKNLQVMFAPLGGTPISIGGISFRKFNATGNKAWRVNLFIGYSTKTDILTQANDTVNFPTTVTIGGGDVNMGFNPEADRKTTNMTFSIRPGYECHMAGTERLSPYCGVEAMFSMTTSKTETDTIGVADFTYYSNSTYPLSSSYQKYTLEKKGKGANTTIGINLFAGVDYYIAKNLSLGAEFGFGFSTTSMPDVEDQYLKTTSTSSTNTTTNVTTYTSTTTVQSSAKQKQGKSMQIGPNVVGQFKLGWLF